ncbi:MAG: InlB B-repeat-containing protein, partial [Bacteroidales bacterium]
QISNQSEHSFLMPAEDLTLIANFEMTDYTLTLIANPEEGGIVVGSGIYNAGDTVNISAIPNLGWEFINWTDSEGNLISNQPEHSFVMSAEDLTLIANFEIVDYTLTLIVNPEEGGTVVGSGIYNAGDTVNISAIPNTGWDFVSWTDSEGNLISNQPEHSFLMPAEDLTLVANFEMTGYILTLVANPEEGGTVLGSGIYNVGDTVNIIAIPNLGWEFINWTDVEGNLISNQPEHSFLMPAEDLILTANFEMTGYVLTLVVNPEEGGTVVGSGIYNVGDTVNISAIPNTGWEFINWTDSEGNLISNQPEHSFLMPAEDLTLIANFEITEYTLTLVANPEAGGIVLGAGIYNFGDEVNIYSFPNTGYTFASWTDINGNIISTNPATVIIMPAGNLTLFANFELIDYTLTLIANPSAGGIVTGAGNYNYGSIVNINAVPNAGYSFVNWTNLNGNIISTDPSATILMPSNNLTLIANFQPNTYNLTLIANPSAGGTVTGAGNYSYGSIINIIAVPNAGYTFVNWTNLQGNVISTDPTATISMPPNNLTLIANFEPVAYTLTLIANPTEGGTVSGGGNYNQGEIVIINAIPNTGYNFENWTNLNGSVISTNPDATFAMPDCNLTLIANFQLITYTVTFEIKDESNNPVIDAIITLGNMSNEPGDYTFENVAPGMYNYEITAPGYQNASGMVAVSQNEIFHIVLHKKMFNIMASAGENGFIEPFGIISVVYGGSQSFLIQANEGFHIADVLIDDVSIGPVSEYEFVNVTSNHSIHAIFEINTYTISVDVNNNDWGIVTGSGIYEHGQLVTLEAIAYSGYRFIEWKEDGAVVSTDTLLVFTALNDRSLFAVFDLTDNISFVEYSDPVFSIYPNPAGDMATISFENSNVTVEAIGIFDIQGRQIAKYPKPEIANDKFILDVSNYISGTYMIQIITAEGALSKRLIVF